VDCSPGPGAEAVLADDKGDINSGCWDIRCVRTSPPIPLISQVFATGRKPRPGSGTPY
jgi:hypothetical protein